MNREEQQAIIVNPPNNRMFPNALPNTNAPMDTTRIPNRILGPIQSNDAVRQEIEAGARKRAETESFIDRREPITLRRTVESIQNGAGVLRGQAGTITAKMAEVAKTIEGLKKLHKQWAKHKSNSFAEETQKQLQKRIASAEEFLAGLKQKERKIAVDIKQNSHALKEFLSSRPREGFPTNGEMLEMFRETEALERELHQIDHLASSKAGVLI